MKKISSQFFLILVVFSFVISSCSTGYLRYPEQLALPVIKALQAKSISAAEDLLPLDKDIVSIVNSNQGIYGATYYNKYGETYNKKNMVAKLTSAFEATEYISKQNNLDWESVKIGAVTPEEITNEDAQYSKVTVDLKFGKEEYQVIYNAIKSQNNGWFLGNDIYFAKKQPK